MIVHVTVDTVIIMNDAGDTIVAWDQDKWEACPEIVFGMTKLVIAAMTSNEAFAELIDPYIDPDNSDDFYDLDDLEDADFECMFCDYDQEDLAGRMEPTIFSRN